MSGMRNEMERLITTALHCNPNQFLHGTVTGTTIVFSDGVTAYKFVSAPDVVLTPWAATGTPTCSGVSLTKDANGFYTGATIEATGCDFVVWYAIGTGIAVSA